MWELRDIRVPEAGMGSRLIWAGGQLGAQSQFSPYVPWDDGDPGKGVWVNEVSFLSASNV